MTLDLRLPIGPLSRLTIWGCPWHGLVQGGVLELPNATQLTWPQPGRGDTRLIEFSGVAPVSRTVEQAAADAAAGKQWRHQAILSGEDAHIYGQALGAGSWLWQDAELKVWRVTLPLGLASSFSAGIDTTIDIERFGAFGADPESYTAALVQADIGQGSPTINGLDQQGAANGPPITGASARIVDTTKRGDRAIIELLIDGDALLRGPSVGYLEVSLSGTGAAAGAAVSVLKTRAQTIGAVAESSTDERVYRDHSFITLETLRYEGTLQISESETTGWVLDPTPEQVASYGKDVAFFGPSSASSSLTGRVVAMWYEDDVAVAVTLDAINTESMTASINGTFSGRRESHSWPPYDTTTLIEETRKQDVTLTWITSTSWGFTLKVDGAVVDTVTATRTQTSSTYYEIDYAVAQASWLQSADTDATFNGATATASESSPTRPPDAGAIPVSRTAAPGLSGRPGVDYALGQLPGPVCGPDGVMYSTSWLAPAALSNHTVGLIFSAKSYGSGWVNWWRGIAYPGGFDPTVVSSTASTAAAFDENLEHNCSWCPVTGELARNEATEVCWV